MAAPHLGFSRMMIGTRITELPITTGPLADLAATIGARTVRRMGWSMLDRIVVTLGGHDIVSVDTWREGEAVGELEKWIATRPPAPAVPSP